MLKNIPLRKRIIWLIAGLMLVSGIIILALILRMKDDPQPSNSITVKLDGPSVTEPAPLVKTPLSPVQNSPKEETAPVTDAPADPIQQDTKLPVSSENKTTETVENREGLTSNTPTLSPPSQKEPTSQPVNNEDYSKTVILNPAVKLTNTSPVFNPDNKKLMAIILADLGLQDELFKKVVEELDPAVTLAFYAFAENAPTHMQEARRRGHELVVMIPMEPYDYPVNDPGPGTLLTGIPAEENIKRLSQRLESLTGYVGVMNHLGSRFTASAADYEPIIVELKRRNLLLLDLFWAPRSLAKEIGIRHELPVIRIKKTFDPGWSREKVISQLDNFAYSIDMQEVPAVLIHAYPEAVEALKEWAAGLKEKPVALAPVSALVLTP